MSIIRRDLLFLLYYHHMKAPKNLCILPFDHQTGLWKAFGWSDPITPDQDRMMRETRMITYDGYLYGLSLGIPSSETAILTDDIYGADVIARAKSERHPLIYTLEKSGQPSLIFQHENWQERILHNKPEWIKTLVRYNPESNRDDLDKTLLNLKIVSDFAHDHQIPFMIEPLVQPTESQKDTPDYDHVLRPELTVRMIHEIYDAGIFPTVWKIEGSDDPKFYDNAAAAIVSYDKESRIVTLGRNETLEQVCAWIKAGAQNDAMIGFAVGRTVFLDAIKKYISGHYTNQEAIEEIGKNYFTLYQTYKDAKTHE